MIDGKQTDSDKRIEELEREVSQMRDDVRTFINSVYAEAGAAKACQTAVTTLLAAMSLNPLVLPALREGLNQAEQEMRATEGLPDSYLGAFDLMRARMLGPAVPLTCDQSRPAGATLQ